MLFIVVVIIISSTPGYSVETTFFVVQKKKLKVVKYSKLVLFYSLGYGEVASKKLPICLQGLDMPLISKTHKMRRLIIRKCVS